MKILFICPNLYDKRSSDAFQPLAFAVLKGLTPDDVETVLYDERIEKIDFEETADLVAISVGTFTAKRSYSIADEFRKRGISVVMGGYHPTFIPEEALQHSDSVLIGDAEPIWEQVVKDARSKSLERIYKGKTSNDTLKGVHYDRSIFKGKKYKVIQPVQYNRGCKYNCDFCSVSEFYGRGSFHRPIKDVVREIESLDKKAIFFIDDNLFAHREDAMRFFKELIPLNIIWGAQISIEAGQDKELLDLMVKSGCILLLMGFETLDIENTFKAWDEHIEEIPVVVFSWLCDLSQEQVDAFEDQYKISDEAFLDYLRTLGFLTYDWEEKVCYDFISAHAEARGW